MRTHHDPKGVQESVTTSAVVDGTMLKESMHKQSGFIAVETNCWLFDHSMLSVYLFPDSNHTLQPLS